MLTIIYGAWRRFNMRWIASLAVLLGVCLLGAYPAEEEPVYRGKKASEWAAQLQGEKDLLSQQQISFVAGNLVNARPGALFKKQTATRNIGLIVLRLIGPDKYPPMVAVIVTALQDDPEPEIRAA